MGYRSDVVIAHAFGSKEHRDEVLTVLTLDHRFADYELSNYIQIGEEDYPIESMAEGATEPPDRRRIYTIVVVGEQWKWYEESMMGNDYPDVACLNSILNICKNFEKNRGFPYAYKFLRIGEDIDDIEERVENSGSEEEESNTELINKGEWLADFLNDSMYLQSSIDKDFRNLTNLNDYHDGNEKGEKEDETLPQKVTA